MGRAKLEIKFAADTDFQKQLFLQFDMFLIDFVSFRLCFFRQFNIAKAALHRDCLGAWADAGRNPFQRMFLGHSTVWEGAVAGTTSRPLPAPLPRILFCTPRPASARLALVSFFMRHMCQSFHKASTCLPTHTYTLIQAQKGQAGAALVMGIFD